MEGLEYQAQQEKTAKEQKQEYDLIIANWREAMRNGAARKVIYDILDMCGIHADKFTGDDRTFILLGRESVGRDILNRLEATDPYCYPRLLTEMIDGKLAK